jgi:hypothetical protein
MHPRKGHALEAQLRTWRELNVKPYDKNDVPPYSRTRGILLNGIEVEAVMFSHQMARNTLDAQVKRQLALLRRVEAQQQTSGPCWPAKSIDRGSTRTG